MKTHCKKTRMIFTLMAAVSVGCCVVQAASASVIYVNAAAPAGGNGQDWARAYVRLQDALSAAVQMPGKIYFPFGGVK